MASNFVCLKIGCSGPACPRRARGNTDLGLSIASDANNTDTIGSERCNNHIKVAAVNVNTIVVGAPAVMHVTVDESP